MKVTKHAAERLRERCSLSRSAIAKTAPKALAEGHSRFDYAGSFRRYLDKQHHVNDTMIRVFNNHVWVFKYGTLLTVYRVPQQYQKYKPSPKKEETDENRS